MSSATLVEQPTDALTGKEQVAPSSSASTFSGLKDRIKSHYDVCSSYYLNLWGQHIHHGYWTPETDTISKDLAQIHIIELLLARAGYGSSPFVAGELGLPSFITDSTAASATAAKAECEGTFKVLDVGCGVGGTTRYLAEQRGWDVTGVTISSEQVKIAYDLTRKAASPSSDPSTLTDGSRIPLGPTSGSVQYLQLDAEQISPHFPPSSFSLILITEALSHLPQKPLFYQNCAKLLKPGGRLIVADWLKKSGMKSDGEVDVGYREDVRVIEEGMLLPPLEDMEGYLRMAGEAELRVRKGGEGIDISENVKRTWDISLSLIQSPSLWAFAFSQGRDFVAFLRAFQAMRRGFGNGNFRYGVVVFEKPEEDSEK